MGKKPVSKMSDVRSSSKPKKEALKASKIYRSETGISVSQIPRSFSRADLEFHGVDHAGASFEARIFINNNKATEKTPTKDSNGYAGTFHIFGHGGCYGDIGHCEINMPRRDYDTRRSHALLPIKKIVTVTESIKKIIKEAKDMKITVVPVITSSTEKCDLEDVLKFDHISLVTYD